MLIYNAEQQKAITYARQRVSFVLTGAAGTGKTTTTQEIARQFLINPPSRVVSSTKNFEAGTPGIFFLAFTRAAVRNLRKNVPEELRANCFTIHRFVEMMPETIYNEDGKATTIYRPARNKFNPFPAGISTLVFDESSMISTVHMSWIYDALPYPVQEIFIGDINQLPTVANFSIFPEKLTTLPVVNLTQIYRQARESPIISFAHKIKDGHNFTDEELREHKSPQLTILRFAKTINDELTACAAYCKIVKDMYRNKLYNPLTDIILCPWNKHFGTVEINRHIATMLDEELRERDELPPIYEVISMFQKAYYRVGDLVLYDKEPAIIKHIGKNALYYGTIPRHASTELSRWGKLPHEEEVTLDLLDLELAEIDEDKVTRQMSHVIDIEFEDGTTETLSTAGEFNNLSLGYSTSIHKAQGSQWPHVILMFHKQHHRNTMREMLYTGVTRAESRVTIICERDTIQKRVQAQAIEGNTVEEKIEWYKRELEKRAKEKQNADDQTTQ